MYRSTMRDSGAASRHPQLLLPILPGTITTGRLFPSLSLSLGPDCNPAGPPDSWWVTVLQKFIISHLLLKQAALNSCTQLYVASRKHSINVMSALECPCQCKGRGVLSDSSCWLSLDVRWTGATWVKKWTNKLKKITWKMDFVNYYEYYSL